jgi:hypothetical protein
MKLKFKNGAGVNARVPMGPYSKVFALERNVKSHFT